MTEAIIVAVIALIGQVVIAAISNSGLISKIDKQSEVSDTQIHGEIEVIKNEVKTLRQSVERHNNLVERTYKVEERVSVNEEKIKVINNRIKDLEDK